MKFMKKIYERDRKNYVKNWERIKNILNMQIEFEKGISEEYWRNIEKLLKL